MKDSQTNKYWEFPVYLFTEWNDEIAKYAGGMGDIIRLNNVDQINPILNAFFILLRAPQSIFSASQNPYFFQNPVNFEKIFIKSISSNNNQDSIVNEIDNIIYKNGGSQELSKTGISRVKLNCIIDPDWIMGSVYDTKKNKYLGGMKLCFFSCLSNENQFVVQLEIQSPNMEYITFKAKNPIPYLKLSLLVNSECLKDTKLWRLKDDYEFFQDNAIRPFLNEFRYLIKNFNIESYGSNDNTLHATMKFLVSLGGYFFEDMYINSFQW